jgi:hypothetical protein
VREPSGAKVPNISGGTEGRRKPASEVSTVLKTEALPTRSEERRSEEGLGEGRRPAEVLAGRVLYDDARPKFCVVRGYGDVVRG